MDVASVASLGSAMSQAKTADAVAMLVLKKTLDLEAQGALQLLQALPAVNNPPHLGNAVDVRA